MKIGLSSYSFRWAFKAGMIPDEFLHLASNIGAEVVQLCENSGVDQLDQHGLKELETLARQLNLVLECGGSGGGNLAKLEAGVRRTFHLDGIIYRCVLDSDGSTPEVVIENLKSLLPLLRKCGVVFCAENHFNFSPQTLRRVVREVDDPAVGICLDPLNSIVQWVGPEETVHELASLARTAHIKDARITRSGAGWVITGVPLGEGQLDLAGYIAAVAPRVESLLLESWMEPVDGELGPRTLEQEALWAKNGLTLVRELASRYRKCT